MQEDLFLVEMVQGHVLKIEKLSITYIDQLELVLDFPNQQKKRSTVTLLIRCVIVALLILLTFT